MTHRHTLHPPRSGHRELQVFDCSGGHVTVVPMPPGELIPATRSCENCDRPAVPRARAGYYDASRPGR